MQTTIKDTFKPIDPDSLLPQSKPDICFWLWNVKGDRKSYIQASGEECEEWVHRLCDIPVQTLEGLLDTATTRAVAMDMALTLAVGKSTKLFGGEEFWDSIPEWKRLKDYEKKQKEKEGKEK